MKRIINQSSNNSDRHLLNVKTIPAAILLVAFVSSAFGTPHRTFAQQQLTLPDQSVVNEAVEQVRKTVVRIETTGGNEQVDGKPFRSQSSTGTVINSQGMVLTAAYNLAHQPSAIFATYSNGRRVPMTVLARNDSRNAVLLKPGAENEEIEALFRGTSFSFVERADLLIGQATIAVGTSETINAEAKQLRLNLSLGVLSSTNRIWGRAIQTDANVSATNYGGPLLDVRGRILGLLLPAAPNAKSLTEGVDWYDSGIGFAVPVDELRLEAMAAGEDQTTGHLGISFVQDRGIASKPIIKEVKDGSGGQNAGLKSGDMITAINSVPVQLATQAKHQLGPLYSGEQVKLAVQRDGKSLELNARLGR